MTNHSFDSESMLRDEISATWDFLEKESEPCAVVSERMELLYLNKTGRTLGAAEWFGKRCFEVLPVTDSWCALHCQTIKAVNQTDEIAYCEENFWGQPGAAVGFGGAIIPLGDFKRAGAQALIVLRPKVKTDDEGFRKSVLAYARELQSRVARQLGGTP